MRQVSGCATPRPWPWDVQLLYKPDSLAQPGPLLPCCDPDTAGTGSADMPAECCCRLHSQSCCLSVLQMIVHGISQVLRPNLTKTAPAAAKPSSGRRLLRRLLQFRPGSGPSVTSNSLTATQNSIRAAVDGTQDVATATAVGGRTAGAASSRCWNCLVNSDPFTRGH